MASSGRPRSSWAMARFKKQRVRGAVVSIGLVPELDRARIGALAERRLAGTKRDACRFGIVGARESAHPFCPVGRLALPVRHWPRWRDEAAVTREAARREPSESNASCARLSTWASPGGRSRATISGELPGCRGPPRAITAGPPRDNRHARASRSTARRRRRLASRVPPTEPLFRAPRAPSRPHDHRFSPPDPGRRRRAQPAPRAQRAARARRLRRAHRRGRRQAALRILQEHHIDLVITDLRMPQARRHGAAAARARARARAAGGDDHGARHGRQRGRGAEDRRLRLPDQALRSGRGAQRRAQGAAHARAVGHRGAVRRHELPSGRALRHHRQQPPDRRATRCSIASPTRRPRCSSRARSAPARSWWRARCTRARRAATGPFIKVNCAAHPRS